MARVCEVCGKSTQMGNSVAHRGKAKYLGGVGTKVTGIARRQFKPNLQRIRITTQNGTHKTVRVCARVPAQRGRSEDRAERPFKLPTDASKTAEK